MSGESPERFEDAFDLFMSGRGFWRKISSGELVEIVENFVTECEKGYRGQLYEYSDFLGFFAALYYAERDPRLARYEEQSVLGKRAALLEDRFQKLLVSDVFLRFPAEEWWNRGAPKRAGRGLVRELMPFGHQAEEVPGR